MPPQDVYARLLLLSAGRGYPLWTPEPSNELLMERRDGLRIGDVGVVLDDGGFDVFFNICLPADHPFHLRYGVPEGFTWIHPGELDIRTIVDAEPPGHFISSSSIMRETSGANVSKLRHDSNTLPYVFNFTSGEGALLVLPKGAERLDLLNDDLFLEQASLHATEWYNYAVNRRRRIISPDSLYLITGIHKTFSWSVAAFENATGNNHTAHFKQIEGSPHAPIYRWETTCAMDWRVGPRINYDMPNQSVFIRGFKIAIRSGLLGTRWISVEADAPSIRPNHVRRTSLAPSNSSILGGLAGFLGLFSSSNRNNVVRTTMRGEGTANVDEERLQVDRQYNGVHVEIQRIPGVFPGASHPSDAINQYLLEKDPSANIAITHDSHWISLLEDNLLVQEEHEVEFSLEALLSQNYRLGSRRGVVYLEREFLQLSDGHPPSTSEGKAATVSIPPSSATHAHIAGEDLDLPDWVYETRSFSDGNSDEGFYNHLSSNNHGEFDPRHSELAVHLQPSEGTLVHRDNSLDIRDSWQTKWSDDDAVDLIMNALEFKQYYCGWTTNGQTCNTPLHGRDFPAHLLSAHYSTDQAVRVRCGWDDCGEECHKGCMVRHIQEKHLVYRWPCPRCGLIFTRRGVMELHRANCH